LEQRTARDVVSLWVPPWVGLDEVQVNGGVVPAAVDSEHGWRLVRVTVEIPPGTPVSVRWQLRGSSDVLPRAVAGPATVTAPSVTTGSCSS
ncbi:MAG: hypothetical protein ACRYF3_01295, partial [Janthinobacterium lividum]